MIKFRKDLTTINKSSRSGNKVEWIVVHYTGNVTDTASANANYFRTVDRQASAHYFVDEHEIVQVVEDELASWSVGVNYGGRLFGTCNNQNSINIEMCGTNGRVGEKTFNQTTDLVRDLMRKYGLGIDRVVRHYDVCNKRCPGWGGWTPNDESLWNKFKEQIVAGLNEEAALKRKASASKVANRVAPKNSFRVKVSIGNLHIRSRATTNSESNGYITPGVYTITETATANGYTWGKLKSGVGWIALDYAQRI